MKILINIDYTDSTKNFYFDSYIKNKIVEYDPDKKTIHDVIKELCDEEGMTLTYNAKPKGNVYRGDKVIGYMYRGKTDIYDRNMTKPQIAYFDVWSEIYQVEEFTYLKNGAFLASVTSSDDELDLSWLQLNYNKEIVSEYIDRYDKNGHYFYLLNRGNAINFIHGAVVGDFILLVQKEMLDTIIYMNQHKLDNVVHESFDSVRKRVAKLWLNYFLKFKI
jgi:hypothetical protein